MQPFCAGVVSPQKNYALTQGNHIKGDFLGRIYQNVFNKRIRPPKITQEIHALQTDQSAFNTFSVLLRSMSRWLKKLNKCASNLGQTWKRNTEKKIKTKSTFGRIFRWFKLLILIRNVLLRLIY